MATATSAEILVVDNASDDESIEQARGFRNRVNFITNSVNRGFAAAINQAFQAERAGQFDLATQLNERALALAFVSKGADRWVDIAHGLLMTNEFAFVD